MTDSRFKDIGCPVTNVIEECAEVIHILCKVQRFGWKNYNPYDVEKTLNIVLVQREIEDLKLRLAELEEEIKGRLNV